MGFIQLGNDPVSQAIKNWLRDLEDVNKQTVDKVNKLAAKHKNNFEQQEKLRAELRKLCEEYDKLTKLIAAAERGKSTDHRRLE
jgi:hypothetical protein